MSRLLLLAALLFAGSAQAQSPVLRALLAGGSTASAGGGDTTLVSFLVEADDLALGAYDVDALDDSLTNSSGSVVSTSGGNAFDPSNADSLLAETTFDVQNVEVVLATQRGLAMVRCQDTDSDGDDTCIGVYYSRPTDQIKVGLVPDVTRADGNGSDGNFIPTNWLDSEDPGQFAGHDALASNEVEWTLGVNQDRVYLLLQGIEVWSDEHWGLELYGAGSVAWWVPNGYNQRLLSVTERTADGFDFGSDPAAGLYHAQDFGVDSLSTTGTIAPGNLSVLKVAGDPGFEVGDWLALAIDTSLVGRGDTLGAGGYLPGQSLQELADTTGANTSLRYHVADRDSVYLYDNGEARWRVSTSFYSQRALPLGHRAQITAISGTDITIAPPAVQAATNIPVYYDNSGTPWATRIFDGEALSLSAASEFVWPEGTWYVAAETEFAPSGSANTIMRGEGAFETSIVTPQGFEEGTIDIDDLNAEVYGFEIRGTQNDDGPAATGSGKDGLTVSAFGVTVRDMRCVDVQKGCAITRAGMQDVLFARIFSVNPPPGIKSYKQWEFNSDKDDTSDYLDLAFTAATLEGAAESFGGDSANYVRPNIVNGILSCNGCTNLLVKDGFQYIEAGSNNEEYIGGAGQTVAELNSTIDFNANAQASDEGGTLTDHVTVFEGEPRVGETCIFMNGMTVASSYENLTVDGGLLWVPPACRPTAAADSSVRNFALQFRGTGHTVTGYRSYGYQANSSPNADVAHLGGGTATWTNIVAENLNYDADSITVTGHQTYTTYEASLGTNAAPTAGFYVRPIGGDGAAQFFVHTLTDWNDAAEVPTWLSSDPDGYLVKFRWDMGDGTTYLTDRQYKNRAVWHQYESDGSYTVELEVEDERGGTDTASCSVAVTNGVITAQTC